MLFAELVSSLLEELYVWLSDYGKVTGKAGEAFIRGSSPYVADFLNPDSLLYLLRNGSSR